jgi:hypothetical protein
MAGRLLDINGLVVDRDRTKVFAPRGRWTSKGVWLFDENGKRVANVRGYSSAFEMSCRTGRYGRKTYLVVAQLLIRCRSFVFIDREGWGVWINSGRTLYWAPLLDLAVEAGLELPEVSRPAAHG